MHTSDSVALLRERFEAYDRDPDSVRIQVSVTPVLHADGSVDLDATERSARELQRNGATVAMFRATAFGHEADRFPELLDWMIGFGHRAPGPRGRRDHPDR